jgi:hypothetical protein
MDITEDVMRIKHTAWRIELNTCMLRMTAKSRGSAAIIDYEMNVNFFTISVAFCRDCFWIFFHSFLEIKYWALQATKFITAFQLNYDLWTLSIRWSNNE